MVWLAEGSGGVTPVPVSLMKKKLPGFPPLARQPPSKLMSSVVHPPPVALRGTWSSKSPLNTVLHRQQGVRQMLSIPKSLLLMLIFDRNRTVAIPSAGATNETANLV